MCLAIPGEIVELLDNNKALVSVGGINKDVDLSLLKVRPILGDFVIVHVGFALNVLNQEEAKKTLALFAELEKESS